MKKLTLVISLLMGFGLGSTASAADLSVEKNDRRGCRRAKLTQNQRKEIRELRKSSQKDMQGLRAQIKEARKSLRLLVLNADSTVEQAAEAQEALLNLKGQAVDIRVANKLHILYNIASVEQRRPLLRCLTKGKGKFRGKGKRKAKKGKYRRGGHKRHG